MVIISSYNAILRCSGLMLLLSLSACSVFKGETLEGKVVETIPVLTPSKVNTLCGNQPNYQLNGQRVSVLSSSEGYAEEGLAIRYQTQRNGQATAGCERYDPLVYSAAHRTLPIPSDARVTRLDNGRSVVVRINDRVPHQPEALIQLSEIAARTLGITDQTVPVRVEGLESAKDKPFYVPSDAGMQNTNRSVTPEMKAEARGQVFYVIVGSYPTPAEAMETFARMSGIGLRKSELAAAQHEGNAVHQVRIGPLYTQGEIDNVKNILEGNGFAKFRVVGINGE